MWYAGNIQNEMGDFTAMHNLFRVTQMILVLLLAIF